MFGLFKPKPAPEGPVAFQYAADFACSAEELYRIIDYGDDICWKRDVGSVEATGASSFRMVLDMLPEHAFLLDISEAKPGKSYAYDCKADPQVGRLIGTTESYDIDPIDDSNCRVTLSVAADFEAGMTRAEWQQEVEMMALGVNNSLAKLKIHAEMGVDTIREIEAEQILAMGDTRH
ncbi:hypothetical protein [Aurantiacibacter sp. D1-12]|uniref:hypothetical protein n=1 Tax=Aurantiacibacter sp. D1-12 TaxID=2993658 RepID=UPI00237CD9BC|nr:hypothetical protein [Aurantiacibacter sp. D1-12]MDE1467387.1 hypothetical protein [Aurantiacibacter sp. D1-12]